VSIGVYGIRAVLEDELPEACLLDSSAPPQDTNPSTPANSITLFNYYSCKSG
jgi:hypothetical protein